MNLQQHENITQIWLKEIATKHSNVALASSMSAEDMILTDMIAKYAPSIQIFTLDTGRLHEETYQLIEQARDKYSIPIAVYYPDASALENITSQRGLNFFYQSVDLRKQCCGIRKVEPLRRALKGRDAWITGLRHEQSVTRLDLAASQWDDVFKLQKYNPMIDWLDAHVWQYIKNNNVPYSTLYDNGFTSIGCAPCTRKIAVGEEARAGRWWWESRDSKECGLHTQTEKTVEKTAETA